MKIQQRISDERRAVLNDARTPGNRRSNAEIDAWVDSNVTNLAQARTLFKQVLKVQRNLLLRIAAIEDR